MSSWIVFAIVFALFCAFCYWQLVIAEGAYLGRWVVRVLYDQFAPHYDRVKQFSPAADAAVLVAPILARKRNACVLDIATGTGRLPLALLSHSGFHGNIIATDGSGKMLAQAHQKLTPFAARVTLLKHDATALPFDTAQFDVVACLEALEFMPDMGASLAEMARVLKPGGLLMISNRIGPDRWKLPGRAMSTPRFVEKLTQLGYAPVSAHDWLLDYDLLLAAKPAAKPAGHTMSAL